MRKNLLIVALILSISFSFAQKNNFSVSYGTLSTSQVLYTFSGLFYSITSSIVGGEGLESSGPFIGPLVLSYHRTLESNERFSFGGALAYDYAKFKEKNATDDKFRYTSITFAPEGKVLYLRPGSNFNIYGLLGAGVTLLNWKNYKSSDVGVIPHFNLQVTPLGFEYGGSFKVFLELGVGYKGVTSGGVSYRF